LESLRPLFDVTLRKTPAKVEQAIDLLTDYLNTLEDVDQRRVLVERIVGAAALEELRKQPSRLADSRRLRGGVGDRSFRS
jgi:hypothetical protein